MKDKTRTAPFRHQHIQLPTTRDVLGWLKKPLAREIEIDAALVALCSFLLGGMFFSLVHAFNDCRVVF
jgi:hypothetical protein